MKSIYMKATVSRCDALQKNLPRPEEGAYLLTDDGAGCWTKDSEVCQEYIQAHGIQALNTKKMSHDDRSSRWIPFHLSLQSKLG